jgi:phosphoserine phosphatase RsbU/P
VIGDVCGHGVAAALIMARVSYDFHRLTCGMSSPSAIFSELNQSIAQHCPDDAFVTAACLRLDLSVGSVTVSNAGHLPPLIRRRSGEVVVPEPPLCLPLGMDQAEVYGEEAFVIEPGDVLLLTTDGLVDALGGSVTSRGLEVLAGLLARAPPDVAEINRVVLAAVQAQRAVQQDDVALVTLEVLEREPPSSSLRRLVAAG